ncbi:MAG: ABC transporter ATP-binding protein [Cellulosilyticaceae bacterium]
MACYRIEGLSFAYSGAAGPSLEDVNLDIEEGVMTLIVGHSGSGKTTLLRHLKEEVWPVGARRGRIYYGETQFGIKGHKVLVEEIAIVLQNPDNQIVMETVRQELVFAMENMGYATEEIQRRMGEICYFFGMEKWLDEPVHHLSGGQKQLLCLAAVMILRPKVLLLDEPTAQLDPIAAKNFLDMVGRIQKELSVTVVINEHHLDEVLPLVDRICVLADGHCIASGYKRDVLEKLPYMPSIPKLYYGLSDKRYTKHPVPLTVNEGKRWFDQWIENHTLEIEERVKRHDSDELVIRCHEIYYQYEKKAPFILRNLGLEVHKGEILALLGGNGSGKSTLLKLLGGAVKKQRGHITIMGKVGYLAQNPMLYFNKETVKEQLGGDLELLGFLGLEQVMNQHPYDLSGGQQQKLALGVVLRLDPDILLLDEPTKSLDLPWKMAFGKLLRELQVAGKTVIMISHDMTFVARFAIRCGLMFDGKLTCIEPVQTFFASNYFYTTLIHRVVGEKVPWAILEEDLLGGEL